MEEGIKLKIYDEQGRLMKEDPDLTKGFLETTARLVEHHPMIPAKEEVTHIEILPGTVGMRYVHVDAPAEPEQPAWDEYENVMVYHPYTEEQLAEMQKPTLEQRVTAAEGALLELMLGGAAANV